MNGSTSTPRDVADRLRSALEANDLAALTDLLDPDVTWGDCAGRADVERYIDDAVSAGVSVDDVAVDVVDDRLVVAYRPGGPESERMHQAMFVDHGKIKEIRDAADRGHASSLRPVGPLADAAARDARLTELAPVLPVRDLAAALDHYRSLGFAVEPHDGGPAYAFAARDGFQVHLAQVDDLDPAVNRSAVYFYVSDADALYAQWRLVRPAGRLLAPDDTEYGLREGAHVDPDGNLLRFGSSIA